MAVVRNVKIIGTGSFAPERVVTSTELAKNLGTEASWIHDNLGIFERRIAGPHEFSSDLGTEAAARAIARAGIAKEAIELIVVATATPDRAAPSTACLIQDRLGIRNRCAAFDMNAVCSGFLYAMTVGFQLIQSGGYRTALIIGVDTFSKITDWTRRDCVFFGDGAGAVVLQATQDEKSLFSSVLQADGSGHDCFTVFPDDTFFTMDGKAVYETGTVVLPEAIRQVLSNNNFGIEHVSAVIPHQPSIRVLKKTAEVLGLPFSKMKYNMDRHANTASATVPLLLDQVVRAGEIKADDLIVFAAVGSGWTWGAAVYRW